MRLKLGGAIFACLALTACSANNSPETWQNFTDKTVGADNLNQGESLVVFYRQPNTPGVAIDVYVNQDYQTSLLNGGFSAIKLCANQNFISTSYTSDRDFGNRTRGIHFYSSSQQITYVKVTSNGNQQPVFTFVDNEQGKRDVEQLQYQSNVLSRVIEKPCSNQNYVTATYQVNFGFDQSSTKSLPANVQQALAQFVQQINAEKVTSVKVNGYSDPVGNSNYNVKLSERRANTVANLIQQSNPSIQTEVNGFGASNVLNNNCAKEYRGNRTLINQCNAENRRVEIAVFGQE
ncbi:outer membrane protein OmpA-like peptidoglycan-associated protein [Volucribacter psittacicida]|uniref:Outer membrane protein OmpA-like peptidoglycan-associated protein n=1 Tax=Volucribacter psittacicida TaxID=203482 RepID=A0A4R1G0E8_9PAST|nr:OmpA family protein [Volucribacter psittacicida]TCJ98418.1 outer membrane protein OmpA-like peptidoglycan-associated protein [Volucribacter psittacicida]